MGTIQSSLIVNDHSSEIIDSIHVGLFSIVQPLAWLVTVGAWSVLPLKVVNPSYSFWYRFQIGAAHTFNLAIPTMDLFLSTTTLKWIQVLIPMACLLVFVATVIAWHLSTSRIWPYEFIGKVVGNSKHIRWEYVTALTICLLIVCLLFYSIVMGLIILRDFLVYKFHKKQGLP